MFVNTLHANVKTSNFILNSTCVSDKGNWSCKYQTGVKEGQWMSQCMADRFYMHMNGSNWNLKSSVGNVN